MTGASISQFTVRLVIPAGGPVDAGELEEIAAELRHELLALGVASVDRVPDELAPPGARAIELVAAIGFLVSATSTAASLTTILEFLQRWRARHARAQSVAVTVDDIEVDGDTAIDAHATARVTGLRGNRAQRTTGRSALIVANAEYRDPALSQLRSPARDADVLADVLRDPRVGGFDVQQVFDADERTVRRRLASFFADRHRDDLLYVHFSCHGLKDRQGRLYLAAADTELRSLGATAVPASFVAEQMSETGSGRVVLVLDCCYSGAFARGAAMRGDRTVHVAEEFGGGTGRIVLTASSATEYAFEGDQLTHEEARPSVFTSALVAGLRSGEADLDGDGEISIDELYDFAYRHVREARSNQQPMKWSFGMAGSLVVARTSPQMKLTWASATSASVRGSRLTACSSPSRIASSRRGSSW